MSIMYSQKASSSSRWINTPMASLVCSIHPTGCGFNVSNSNPTICLNDLVALHNREHGTGLAPLSISLLIARSVSTLEALIADVQEKGPDAALPTYYKRWMHR